MSIAKEIRDNINANVALTALGNSDRKMKDVAADLINASGVKHKQIASDAFLCTTTVKNLATGKTLNPQSETVERIFRLFALQLDLKAVKQHAKFANKAKK